MTTISIGSGSAPLNLPAGIPMSGFAARTKASVGDASPAPRAGAVAFDNVVLVLLDTVGVDTRLTELIRERAGLNHTVHVHAIHTHSGPCVLCAGLGDLDEASRDKVATAGARAAQAAAAGQQPCTVEWAEPTVPGRAFNRREGFSSPDAKLKAIRWSDTAGDVAGMLVAYPCHPTSAGHENLELSADYPGYLRDALESDGVCCHFMTGCAGELNTGHTAGSSFTKAQGPIDRTLNASRKFGTELGAAVEGTTWRPLDLSRGVRLASTELDLAMEPRGLTPDELRRDLESRIDDVDPGTAVVWRIWIEWSKRPDAHTSAVWSGHASWIGIGELDLFLLPGEPFLKADLALSAEFPGPVMVGGYTDDCPGYLPGEENYAEGGYEVDDAHRYYGMPAPFAPGSLEAVIDAVAALPDRRP